MGAFEGREEEKGGARHRQGTGKLPAKVAGNGRLLLLNRLYYLEVSGDR